jgi:aminoglycoside 3-N-acetyltransferase
VRSLHPTHSVAALGHRAREFCAGHESDDSPCSPTSPYGRLLESGGKILLLGVDLTRCTFIHCLEEIAGLGEIWSLTEPARRYCIRSNGEVIPLMARSHKDYKSDNYGRAEADLIRAGIVVPATLGPARLLLADTPKLADHFVPLFRQDPRYFW